ncbi:alpha-ketoglutarate-dependent dioxygenase AlkB [Psychromonas sp. SR45-3]|uniref:alpha-ketoglutarate-dependent dioxygenase AlkB n=1 Tax=Psychromonas sp. SR45-3 TaxID=2760930 RepID=UPI0038F78B30
MALIRLGAERKFSFKHKQNKPNQTISLVLEYAGLLVMQNTTQIHWWYCLPPAKKVFEPRINLTFRIIEQASPAFI